MLRQPATISPACASLIAAYTSYQNDCGFCTQAHAAAAAELLGDEELVWQALRDLEGAPLDEKTKALLRFVGKDDHGTCRRRRRADIDALRAAGWDDEAIYYAITTCALFNFYNRWITATGVPEMSRGGASPAGPAPRRARLHPGLRPTRCHTSHFPTDLPGIRGPMAFRPETAKPLNELVDVLLRGPHSLTPASAS